MDKTQFESGQKETLVGLGRTGVYQQYLKLKVFEKCIQYSKWLEEGVANIKEMKTGDIGGMVEI